MSEAWLIVSDSGGVQEEAPSLGKPLLILRENTERPEVVTSGIARLVGGNAKQLFALLQETAQPGSWVDQLETVENPFGRGDAGPRIADAIAKILNIETKPKPVSVLREVRPSLAPMALGSRQ